MKILHERGLHIHQGEKHYNSKITESIAIKIFNEFKKDNYRGKITDISKKYNVTQKIVSDIKNKKSWKHIHD